MRLWVQNSKTKHKMEGGGGGCSILFNGQKKHGKYVRTPIATYVSWWQADVASRATNFVRPGMGMFLIIGIFITILEHFQHILMLSWRFWGMKIHFRRGIILKFLWNVDIWGETWSMVWYALYSFYSVVFYFSYVHYTCKITLNSVPLWNWSTCYWFESDLIDFHPDCKLKPCLQNFRICPNTILRYLVWP